MFLPQREEHRMSKIPKFDKREVDAGRLSYSGSVDDSEHILHVGDEVTHVVKGKVTKVSFTENQFGVMRRVHSVSVDHMMPAADTVSAEIEREIKRRADEESGQSSMDDDIDGDTGGE